MQYLGPDNLDLFFEFLKEGRHQMKSCSESEIAKIVHMSVEKSLPESYIKFMKYAGNGIDFLRGSSYESKELMNLKEWAIDLLEENNSSEKIDDNLFVFFMHQGYQFYFFNIDEGDDPPVYFYSEGENNECFVKKHESFSRFLIEYYNDIENLFCK